nr:reverse transcriptase domain-containing protein [Tanacetum cinerariifolium]
SRVRNGGTTRHRSRNGRTHDSSHVYRRSEERTHPANFKVALHPDFPDQDVAIGGTLSDKGRTDLCFILKKNLDIFAWQPSDMTGASRSDCYPLPEIDCKVESLCSYPFKCFLDAYKGYHQIQLVEADEEKTAFHTGQGVYCYMKMPFGLKNAGTTYHRYGNDTHTDDADINSVNDTQLMAEVNRNTTPESTDMSHRGGEIDQNDDAKKCQASYTLPDPSFDNMTTEFSN